MTETQRNQMIGFSRKIEKYMTSLTTLNDSIEIIADEKGREIRKSADHPDKTRDIIFLDEDEENQENENSNNTSVLLVWRRN